MQPINYSRSGFLYIKIIVSTTTYTFFITLTTILLLYLETVPESQDNPILIGMIFRPFWRRQRKPVSHCGAKSP